MITPRTIVAGAVVLEVLALARPARAVDVQACLAASENGQRARASGKLRLAHEQFLSCSNDGCPSVVRQDCAQWNVEVTRQMPTMVFGARDKQRRDLFDVVVTMDGEPILRKLDGKSVDVDPGKHTFKFDSPGFSPVTETILVKEGERARLLEVVFEPKAPAGKPAGADAPAPVVEHGGGHTIYPWLLVGAGGAAVVTGLVIALTAPDRPAGCDEASKTCVRAPGQSAEDFAQVQEDAGRADSQPTLGFVVMGAGAAVAAGGLVWHFLEPTRPTTAYRVAPWTTGQSSGLMLGGHF